MTYFKLLETNHLIYKKFQPWEQTAIVIMIITFLPMIFAICGVINFVTLPSSILYYLSFLAYIVLTLIEDHLKQVNTDKYLGKRL